MAAIGSGISNVFTGKLSGWGGYAPRNLLATAFSTTEIYLTWISGDSIKIERCTDDITFVQITTVAAGVNYYLDTGLTPGNTYYYRIRAYKGALNSPYSNEATEKAYTYLIAGYTYNANANDYSGNGHHGAVTGASLVAAKFGNGYDFPANAGQKIEVPDDNPFTIVTSPDGLTFTNHAGNPVIASCGEGNIIMRDANTCDFWYKLPSTGDPKIYHRYADNATLDNWSAAVECSGVTGYFPSVVKNGSIYYMFTKAVWASGHIYLYQSTDRINWSIMNGGNPVIMASANLTDWNYYIYNVSVVIIGTKFHALVEGAYGSGGISAAIYNAAYTTAEISNPVFTLPSKPTLWNMANPALNYSAKRNQIIVTYDILVTDRPAGVPIAQMRILYGEIGMDLTKGYNWNRNSLKYSSISPISSGGASAFPSDMSICFTPSKTNKAMMYYCWNQAVGNFAYFNLNNEEELIDSLVPYGFSVAFWMKADAVGTVFLVSKDNATGNLREWNIYLVSNTIQSDEMNSDSSKYIRTNAPFGAAMVGSWKHIVVIHTGSNTVHGEGIRIFIDGVESQTRANSVNFGSFQNSSNLGCPVYVGSYNGTGYYFDGIIDEVRIYNKSLTSREINYIALNTKLY